MTQLVDIQGLAQLDAALKTLTADMEGKVVRGGLLAGQKVIAQAARDNLEDQDAVKTGELRKSIRVRFKRKSQKFGWVRYEVVAGGKKAWYSHLIEFGTASFYSGKGKTVGKPYKIKAKKKGSLSFGGLLKEQIIHPGIKPRPFMRPAFDENSKEALEAMAEYIRKRLPRELKKVAK